MADVPKRAATDKSNVVRKPSSSRPVHRKLVLARSTATGAAVRRSEGREVLQLEQVRARVAALPAAVAALHFDHRESPAASGGRGHSHLAFDVQEPHGPAPAAGRPRPRRRRCLSEAGARAGWRRRARRLVVRRSRVLPRGMPLAGEDGVEQAGEPRARRGRPAAAAAGGGGGGRLPRSPRRRARRGRLLLLRWSHRGRPDGAARGADGAEAAEGVFDLGRREVATAGGAVVRGRRRRARRPVAGGQGGLVVVVVMQGRLLLLLGAPRRRWCRGTLRRCSLAAGLLVQGVADGVQQRRREGRLARPPPRPLPRRRPPLHCWRVVEKSKAEESRAACGAGQ